jgi:hypothetical protein
MKVGVNLLNFGPGVTPEALASWTELAETLGYHVVMNLGSENGLSCPRHTAWCPPRCRVITVGRRVITVGGV